MQPWTLFVNAQAGLHTSGPTPDDLRSIIHALGLEVQVCTTESEDDMCKQIRSLIQKSEARIAVAGGDGTIHAAVQCLAHSDAIFAIIPTGTRNNFAHALGIPREVNAALESLRFGEPISVDLGHVEGIYFTEAAGIGVYADILDAYGRTNKDFWRGLYAIWRGFLNLRARRLRLEVDGVKVTERAVMCTFANSYRMGAGAPMAPQASVTDGELDLVILGDLSRLELIRYYRAIQANQHLSLPKVQTMRAKRVRVESATPMPLHVDDRVVATTPVDIEVHAGCLRVLLHADGAATVNKSELAPPLPPSA